MGARATLFPWRRRAVMEGAAPQLGEAVEADAAELRARREEITRMEERALRETESLGVQRADLERRDQALDDRERNLVQQNEELKRAKRSSAASLSVSLG